MCSASGMPMTKREFFLSLVRTAQLRPANRPKKGLLGIRPRTKGGNGDIDIAADLQALMDDMRAASRLREAQPFVQTIKSLPVQAVLRDNITTLRDVFA